MTPPSLPSPTRPTPLQVLPLSASPNKLPAQSKTVSQGTPPNTGAEAGFKPRHSGSGVHAYNQNSEIVTVNVNSIGVSPASIAYRKTMSRNLQHDCWISLPSLICGVCPQCSPPILSCPSTWASSLMANDYLKMLPSCPGCSLLGLLIL